MDDWDVHGGRAGWAHPGRGALDPTAAAVGAAAAVVAGPITPEAIVAEVARVHGLLPEQLAGRGRTHRVVAARQQAMWLARHLLDLSYATIGRTLGRDHTTVMHGVAQVETRRGDVAVRRQLATAIDALGGPAQVAAGRVHPPGWAAVCRQVLDRARDDTPRCECAGECGLWHPGRRCELRDDQQVLATDGGDGWRVRLAVVAVAGDTTTQVAELDDLRALCQPCLIRHARHNTRQAV